MEEGHLHHNMPAQPSTFQRDCEHSAIQERSMSVLSHNEVTSTAIDSFKLASQHRIYTNTGEQSQPQTLKIPDKDIFPRDSKLKTDAGIHEIENHANMSLKRDRRTSPMFANMTLKNRLTSSKFTQGLYETQNDNINCIRKTVEDYVREVKYLITNNQLKYSIAVHGRLATIILAAKITLSILQLYGDLSSGSLSLFAVMADASFDLMSNPTLLCNKAFSRVDPRKFPAAKARIEIVGRIWLCFLMIAVNFIIIAFSARDLAKGSSTKTSAFHLTSIIIISVTFITKSVLLLYCFSLRNQVSQARIFWEHHRNDIMINTIGILTSVGGIKLRWWTDPIGALMLSLLGCTMCLRNLYYEFQLLVGATADIEVQQLSTRICMFLPFCEQIMFNTNQRGKSYDLFPIYYHH